jgi:hypothetical protein
LEDNIQMDLIEIRWENVEWIILAQDRDQWADLVSTEGTFGLQKRRRYS